MSKNTYLILGLILLAILILAGTDIFQKPADKIADKINGLIMLIEFEEIEGILHWEKTLDEQGITALIQAQENVLNEFSDVFKRLANKGYEISGLYAEEPLWDVSYERQYALMKEAKEAVECITNKPMRVFASCYFAYDENTVKAAEDLGIGYILARGTAEEKAVVYKPEGYNVKIVSVSNVPFEEMGRGSLCDYSLWARGADAEKFGEVIDYCLDNEPSDMILVSHSYLGGTRLTWWQEYEKALNSDKITWRTDFDEWLTNLEVLEMPFDQIPQNREVQYTVPKPAKGIEDYEPIPGLEEYEESPEKEMIEMMCF